MNVSAIRKAIAATGAVLEGNFFFALKKEGVVSTKYINLDAAFSDPDLIFRLGALLIEPWQGVEVIAAPAVGGIPLIYAASRASITPVATVWADKQKNGTFAFERMNFARKVRGKSVVVLEDIVSSGGSAQSVAGLVHEAGGKVVGGSFVWNRGNVTAEAAGLPKLHSLVTESVTVWKEGEHLKWGEWPLVEDVGHPEHFPDYPGPRIKLLAA